MLVVDIMYYLLIMLVVNNYNLSLTTTNNPYELRSVFWVVGMFAPHESHGSQPGVSHVDEMIRIQTGYRTGFHWFEWRLTLPVVFLNVGYKGQRNVTKSLSLLSRNFYRNQQFQRQQLPRFGIRAKYVLHVPGFAGGPNSSLKTKSLHVIHPKAISI